MLKLGLQFFAESGILRAPGNFVDEPTATYVIKIYNNDGSGFDHNDGLSDLFSVFSGDVVTVTKTGLSNDTQGDVWNHSVNIRGFATSANATEPVYAVGDSFTVTGNMTFYIVEGEVSESTTITYADVTIASLEAGEATRLKCSGKKMKTNVTITFTNPGSITYNDTTIDVEAGMTATIKCAGKKMKSNVVVSVFEPEPELEQLTTPTITLDGNTLNIFDESGLATSATVYVDGEAKETVEINRISLISFTIDGTEYQAEDGMTWEEWCESEYNMAGVSIGDGYVKIDNTYIVVGGTTELIKSTATIIDDTAYVILTSGSGGATD